MKQRDATKESRIDELEARLAQQDQSLFELSDEVYRHQRRIDELETALRHLVERVRQIEQPVPAGTPEDQVPPHY